jgi:alpha-D-xyloside xylohydrolase
VVLVRDGSVIPHIALAQSTSQMDWSKLNLVVYSTGSGKASGLVCLPSDKILHNVSLVKNGNGYKIENDPFAGKVKWNIKEY